MGENRFSVYYVLQLGLAIKKDYNQLVINLPFLEIRISFSKDAKGVEIFNYYL